MAVDTMRLGMEALPVFEEMQATGMFASRKYFEALSSEMWDEMMKVGTRISHRYYNDRPFNPGSYKQVGALLRRRGLKGLKFTKTGEVSTSKDSIGYLAYTDEAIGDVFKWRELRHIKDSFCDNVVAMIPPEHDLYNIHCNVKVTRTTSRRIATSDPNLLNIPTRASMITGMNLGNRVRMGYIAPSGYRYGAWDLTQIEMGFMAHESKDRLLSERIRDGKDIHSETAASVFGVSVSDVTKEQRTATKATGFGIIYGIGGAGLLTQFLKLGLTGWSASDCDKLIEEWLEVYSGVRDYMLRITSEVQQTGFIRDHWGMIRYLPGAKSTLPGVAAEAGRHAVSQRIQGGAQGMIQNSMIHLAPIVRAIQAREDVRWCLQVYDELILMFEPKMWEVLNAMVLDSLINHSGVYLRVPIRAEGACSRTWGGLK